MARIVISVFAAATLLVLTASAEGNSGLRLRGTVTEVDAARSFITVSSARKAHVLRVPSARFDRIRLQQRVELRGTTLRSRGNRPRVLARRVLFIRSEPLPALVGSDQDPVRDDDNDTTDDSDDLTDNTTDDTDDTTDDSDDDDDSADDDNSGPGNGGDH